MPGRMTHFVTYGGPGPGMPSSMIKHFVTYGGPGPGMPSSMTKHFVTYGGPGPGMPVLYIVQIEGRHAHVC